MTITATTGSVTSAAELTETTDNPAVIRPTFSRFPSGVVVVAAEVNREKHALVASSFMAGVSMEPCLVALAVQRTSETWPILRCSRSLGVSVVNASQALLTRQLSGKDRTARFDEVAVEVGTEGAVFVDHAAVWLECRVYAEQNAGDHWMVLLEAKKLGYSAEEPLVWHGSEFRGLADIDIA
jgi:flavin reductase (DIM6/NTAB) family NADH-FMN oxidoreductase RutF